MLNWEANSQQAVSSCHNRSHAEGFLSDQSAVRGHSMARESVNQVPCCHVASRAQLGPRLAALSALHRELIHLPGSHK